ncbi:hypothetical protein MJM43_24895, partial [Salmonella enterica subsp. enterica serovar Montevideo]|nr:hypothetical protein [Salmonella enterica subsp. enterica serovar Montevideo]
QKRHWQRKCPQCQQSQHEHSAQYCMTFALASAIAGNGVMFLKLA